MRLGQHDAVVLDPPRAGCEPAAIVELIRLGAGRIVYVSCEPSTHARDVVAGARNAPDEGLDLVEHAVHDNRELVEWIIESLCRQALAQVAEIKAARVVSSAEGVIQEIHVLAAPSKAPKQLVRDIESTIMARFGIPIDHKKISIAQLGHEAVGKNGSKPPSVRPRIVSINSTVSGVRTTVAVTLDIAGTEYVGRAAGPNSQTGRQRLVAEATLDAIAQHGDCDHTFALEDGPRVDISESDLISWFFAEMMWHACGANEATIETLPTLGYDGTDCDALFDSILRGRGQLCE